MAVRSSRKHGGWGSLVRETESRSAAEAGCFPEPTIADESIRRGEDEQAFLARSTGAFAVEMRRFVNGNLRLLPLDVAVPLCKALHGEKFRPSYFELVVARTLQVIGARELAYELEAQTGSHPDLRATYDDGVLVVDATVPDFDAEIVKDQQGYEPLIDVIENLTPAGWTFFVDSLPCIGPNDSRKGFKDAIKAEFAKIAELQPPDETISSLSPLALEIRAEHPQGEIQLRLGGRPADRERAYGGGPTSLTYGDTDARVEKALRRKRAQLRGGDAPAIVAIAGGMGESIEDFDIALFGRTFERLDEHRRVVETGLSPAGIWGKLQGGESVLAGVLVFCRWRWTLGDDTVLYVNPRYRGSLPRALEVVQRRELRRGSIASTTARASGIFPLLRAAAGLAP